MVRFLKKFCFFSSSVLLCLTLTFFVLNHFFPLHLDKVKTASPVFYDNNQTLIHCLRSKDDKWRLRVHLKDIDPHYISNLIEKEDKGFWTHYGISPKSLLRAFYQNVTEGRIVSGGSTITMQTARLLEPRPRKYSSKLIEIFRALQLEVQFSKKQILEIYLNLVPFGGDLEGVKSATYAYFKKEPLRLLPSEIATLIAIPQSPNQYRPDLYPEKLKSKRNKILNELFEKGLINEPSMKAALSDPIPKKRHIFPSNITHLAYQLRKETPDLLEFKTFINKTIQERSSKILKVYEKNLPPKANTALLIQDHRENTIITYVGSSDYFNTERLGQNDFCQAIRSPGSTLKPIIYALAFDEGLIAPNTLFSDSRKYFGAYAPYNFDRQYHGILSAEEALKLSLNIPSVELLNLLGPIKFYASIQNIGVHLKFQNALVKPNLSMALGGVGTNLVDLTLLYSAIANQGQAIMPRFHKGEKESAPKFLFYASSAEKTKKMLEANLLTELSQGKKIALKTGTSFGYRDALAMSITDRFVIGIWVGTPASGNLQEKTGYELAVPILRQILNILPESPSLKAENSQTPKGFSLKSTTKQHILIAKTELYQERLELLFPRNHSEILLTQNQPLTIRFKGGTKPYRIFINNTLEGHNIQSNKFEYLPFSEGYHQISVQDSKGKFTSCNFEIKLIE